MDRAHYTFEKRIGINLINRSKIASKIIFTQWYAKPSWAPTHLCLPCCVILACSWTRTWDQIFVFQMNHSITNFLLLVISIHTSRVSAHEAGQQACHRFISVVCGFGSRIRLKTGNRRTFSSSDVLHNGPTFSSSKRFFFLHLLWSGYSTKIIKWKQGLSLWWAWTDCGNTTGVIFKFKQRLRLRRR
jgi:hypothetical protein